MKTYKNNQTVSMLPADEFSSKTDASHLGVLIGDPNSDRIVAVSTSAVFEDRSLPQTFWGIDNTTIDSGFQGHLYTRPNDILVVRVPHNDGVVPEMVMMAISVNYEIWKSLTGIELSAAASRLVLASDHPSPPTHCLPEHLTWHVGSLLDAAATRYWKKGESLLAFVLNNQFVDMLGLRCQDGAALLKQAQITSLLMDKNFAMQTLQDNGVDCARTYPVNEDTDLERAWSLIPSGRRYVFKPAGGAAGIGVFGNTGRGARLDLIRDHLNALKHKNQLPNRFQIQEFVPGIPLGVTAYINQDGTFEIFETHQQIINDAGRFIGGKWTAALQAEQMESVRALYRQLATIEQPRFSGLICLDIIAQKIIEINPRLTASAPVAHLLRRQNQLSRHLGGGLRIERIDLNTNLHIPYESIRNGTLRRLVEDIWEKRGVLVLPQGLNPFGGSRFIFINDDGDGTVQRNFIQCFQ